MAIDMSFAVFIATYVAIAADGVRTTSSRTTTAPLLVVFHFLFLPQPAKDSFNYISTDDKELEKVVDNMGSYIFTQKQKLLGIANQQL
jgi:hypothetical protein